MGGAFLALKGPAVTDELSEAAHAVEKLGAQAEELYEYAPVTGTDYEIPVCSGDMLFNVLDEYLGFLN